MGLINYVKHSHSKLRLIYSATSNSWTYRVEEPKAQTNLSQTVTESATAFVSTGQLGEKRERQYFAMLTP